VKGLTRHDGAGPAGPGVGLSKSHHPAGDCHADEFRAEFHRLAVGQGPAVGRRLRPRGRFQRVCGQVYAGRGADRCGLGGWGTEHCLRGGARRPVAVRPGRVRTDRRRQGNGSFRSALARSRGRGVQLRAQVGRPMGGGGRSGTGIRDQRTNPEFDGGTWGSKKSARPATSGVLLAPGTGSNRPGAAGGPPPAFGIADNLIVLTAGRGPRAGQDSLCVGSQLSQSRSSKMGGDLPGPSTDAVRQKYPEALIGLVRPR